ncbi:hypothetical protein AAMO2058_001506600 [Amorphochlora amoebiformis]
MQTPLLPLYSIPLLKYLRKKPYLPLSTPLLRNISEKISFKTRELEAYTLILVATPFPTRVHVFFSRNHSDRISFNPIPHPFPIFYRENISKARKHRAFRVQHDG